jgi:hypothetical protein
MTPKIITMSLKSVSSPLYFVSITDGCNEGSVGEDVGVDGYTISSDVTEETRLKKEFVSIFFKNGRKPGSDRGVR